MIESIIELEIVGGFTFELGYTSVNKLLIYVVPHIAGRVYAQLCRKIEFGVSTRPKFRNASINPLRCQRIIAVEVKLGRCARSLCHPIELLFVSFGIIGELQLRESAYERTDVRSAEIDEVERILKVRKRIGIAHINLPLLWAIIHHQLIFVTTYGYVVIPRDAVVGQRLTVVTALNHQVVRENFLVVAKCRLITLTRTESSKTTEYRLAIFILLKEEEGLLLDSHAAFFKAGCLCDTWATSANSPKVIVEVARTEFVRLLWGCPVDFCNEFRSKRNSVIQGISPGYYLAKFIGECCLICSLTLLVPIPIRARRCSLTRCCKSRQ